MAGQSKLGSWGVLPLGFALAVMVAAILVNVTTVPTNAASGNTVFCANPAQNNCIPPNSAGTTYYCNPTNALGYFQACKILPNCSAPPYPYPAFCISDPAAAAAAGCFFQWVLQGSAGCGVYLQGGFSVFIGTSQLVSSITSQGTVFGFTGGLTGGFLAMIGIAVGLISLAGLTVFGSGEQGEGLHILFQGGMISGLWLILAGLEGFPQAGELFFNGMNASIAGSGTFLYAIMTLFVVIGFVGLTSRGS